MLATGANRDLAEDPGCAFTHEDVVDVDVTVETSLDDADEPFGGMVGE